MFRKNRKHFISLYQDLQNTVQMPIHVIRVVRNPYDNIATMLLYIEHQKFSVNETHKYEDEEGLDNQINNYFHQVRSVVEFSVNETHKYEDEEGLDNQINNYFHQVRSVVEMIDEIGVFVFIPDTWAMHFCIKFVPSGMSF